MLENRNGVIRNYKWKDRQYNERVKVKKEQKDKQSSTEQYKPN
jgi:hypothetical protein